MNNLSNIIASPVTLNIKYGNKKIELLFRRISIADRQRFIDRWGDEWQKGLSEMEMSIIMPTMYMLLCAGEKEKLEKLMLDLVSEDEDGNVYRLSNSPYEALQVILSGDWASCYAVLLECAGITKEMQDNFNSLSEEKKKQILSDIEKLTTQDSSPESQSQLAGQ